MPQTVSCLTRRVCFCGFEWSGLRKHPDVGLEPDLNVVRRSSAVLTLVNVNLLFASSGL
jgi:hypothetical protein